MPIPRLNKNFCRVTYKLLGDLLFLLLAFFFVALIADGLIPGIVSDHISFLRIIIMIALNLAALYVCGYLGDVRIKETSSNKKTAVFLAVMSVVLIFNELLKINLAFSITILITSSIAIFFLFRYTFKEKGHL